MDGRGGFGKVEDEVLKDNLMITNLSDEMTKDPNTCCLTVLKKIQQKC